MTIFYVDPVGGNNANNGQSFANRVKSLNALATSGTDFADEIRFIEDPADVSLGNFTFTNGNLGIVPDTPLDVVNLFSGTTAYTGVVSPTTQQSAARAAAQATGQTISATAASAIGKLAYYTLPSTANLSAYDTLSFLSFGTHYLASLDIKLCSDATGDVPIASFHMLAGVGYDPTADTAVSDTVTLALASNMLLPIAFRGVTLPNGVNSIAIYRRAVVAAGTFSIANMTASKLASGLNHLSLFGKKTTDEPAWYSVRTITPNLVEIGANVSYSADRTLGLMWRPYFGVNGSAACYAKNPYYASPLVATRQLSNNAAHDMLGGYNRTDMSTKTGVTSLHTGIGAASPILNPSKYVAKVDSFNFINCNGQVLPTQQAEFTNLGVISRLSSGNFIAGTTNRRFKKRFHFTQITQCHQIVIGPATGGFAFEALIDLIKDPCATSTASAAIVFGQSVQNVDPVNGGRYCRVKKLSNGGGNGIQLTNGISLSGPTVFENMRAGVVHIIAAVDGTGPVICTGFPDTTNIQMSSVSFTGVMSSEYRTTTAYWSMDLQTALNHGSATRSPQFTLNGGNNPTAQAAATVSAAQIYVEAGKTLTFKMWHRGVSSTGTALASLLVKAMSVGGLDDDAIVSVAPTTGTWVEATLTVTPTTDGIVNVECGLSGASTDSCVWSDPSWTIT